MHEHPDLNFVPRRVQTDPVAEALELFPYALYIVGSRGSDNINGMMADWVMQVSFEPFQCGQQRCRNFGAVAGRTNVTRNSDHAGDPAVLIKDRQLGGEAPIRTTAGIPVQLQAIEDGTTALQD